MKHKHAEVLIAIAEGKEVQWLADDDTWVTPSNQAASNPLTYPHLLWRIKLEPKPDVVITATLRLDPDDAFLIYRNWQGNVEVTFDGESRQLKSVRMLP